MNPQLSEEGALATRIQVGIRRYPGIRRLAGDYTYAFPPLAPFYEGDPARPEAWRPAIERTQAHARDREGIAGVISAQQLRRGAPPEARTALARLRQDGLPSRS